MDAQPLSPEATIKTLYKTHPLQALSYCYEHGNTSLPPVLLGELTLGSGVERSTTYLHLLFLLILKYGLGRFITSLLFHDPIEDGNTDLWQCAILLMDILKTASSLERLHIASPMILKNWAPYLWSAMSRAPLKRMEFSSGVSASCLETFIPPRGLKVLSFIDVVDDVFGDGRTLSRFVTISANSLALRIIL